MEKRRIYELKNFNLDNDRLLLNETLFNNANGYIGVRYSFEEGYPDRYQSISGQYINGFYDITTINQAEGLYGLTKEKQVMLNISDTKTIRFFFDGEEFSMFEGTVLESSLQVDMDKGVTIRSVLWRSPYGKEMKVNITRMASFHQLPLFTIDYEVEPLNFSGDVLIESRHNGNVMNFVDPNDPRTAEAGFQYLIPISCQMENGASYITSRTTESCLGVCSCVKNVMYQENHQEFLFNDNTAICRITTAAAKGKKLRLTKYAVFCDTIRYGDCKRQVEIEMKLALSVPLQELYRKQEEYLYEFWKNCYVEIEANDEMDTALQYNLYQMIQSVGKDQYSSITPKGLSGEGYEGHYFWDTEMYIQPFFTITNPGISKRLIEYRYAILDYAKENAKILGHEKGALYPWRTIMGKECSGYFPSGSAQYHINGAIAYSIIAYYLATKDLAFVFNKGAEIIFETARLWLDVGDFYQGRFHINDVTGPDEYTCIVNNNYYTNVLAQYHLRWAVKFFRMLRPLEGFSALTEKIKLREEEIEEFYKAAENMYLPYDDELKINPQDDSFLQKKKWDIESIPKEKFPLLLHYHPLHLYRHQICKQADTVLAHFILEDSQDEETIRNSYLYYEKITTHDSSLSKCIFSIMAAKLGMEKKAYEYFNDAVFIDLLNHYQNTKDGIHMANMGGNYMAVVYGFGGLRLKENGLYFSPILPEQWMGYRFKISYEGSRIAAHIKEKECIFYLEDGEAKTIFIYGKEYFLEGTIVIERGSKE